MESATVAVSDQIELVIEALSSTLTTYGLSVVGAIVTLIVGVWFAGYASR